MEPDILLENKYLLDNNLKCRPNSYESICNAL